MIKKRNTSMIREMKKNYYADSIAKEILYRYKPPCQKACRGVMETDEWTTYFTRDAYMKGGIYGK